MDDNAEKARAMSDRELVDVWDKVEDGENLTELEAAVIAEIERRELDL